MKTPVYMDYHATTPVDRRVLDAMLPFFTDHFGNAASVQHRFGWIAKEAAEASRRNIATAINAQPREIIFTSGATESNNLAVKGITRANRDRGDHLITTAIEHPSVLDSCRALEREGFSVTVLPVDAEGRIDPAAVTAAMTERTVLVSVMMANNEIGTVQPIREIAAVCRQRGIAFHTDATQCIGSLPVDVQAMDIQAMSFTSHKLYGPKGVGALFLRQRDPKVRIGAEMDGGGHEFGHRSGTLNVAGIVGFGKAVQIAVEAMPEERKRLQHLREALERSVTSLEQVSVNGSREHRLPGNLNVTFHGVNAEMLMTHLSDIAVAPGAACHSQEAGDERYSHVLRAIGLNEEAGRSTIRFGLGRFTTEEEVEYVGRRIAEGVGHVRTLTTEAVL